MSRWDFYAFCLLVAVCILQLFSWFDFPSFLDGYYHLSVTRGFNEAGGWVGISFWEAAPYGRPHLYPPIFHLFELFLFKAGLGLITIARISEFIIYPLFLYTCWRSVRSLFSQGLALFFLLLLVSSYPLYLSIINNIPFSISLIFIILAFYSFEKNKSLAALLLLGLSFYSHPLICWIGWVAFLFYAVFNEQNRRGGLLVCFFSLVCAVPMVNHELKYMNFVHFQRVLEFYYFEINCIIYGLALPGIFYAFKKKGRNIFFLSLMISMSVLFFTNRDRFLSGQGILPLSFFAALTLNEARIYLKTKIKYSDAILIFAAIFFLFIITPKVTYNSKMALPKLTVNSWLYESLNKEKGFHRDKAVSFYNARFIDPLVSLVKQYSLEGEIVFSNYSYGGAMVALLADRPTSTSMLGEVLPFVQGDPLSAAKVILWFKEPDGSISKAIDTIIDTYNLKKAAETEIALLYINGNSKEKAIKIRAAVPFIWCFALILGVLTAILIGDRAMKKKLT
ncbi:MAG TPA: hypothetical protein PLU24_00455 [Candidatus Omnitrophota bacterium]|nr:hypothetical protein [Candidatus Omnitrophota bacterium]